MAQIKVKFDHSLEQSPIVLPLVTPTAEQTDGESSPNKNVQQTLLYGILAPLVKINDIVVDINDVMYFQLDGRERIPSLSLIIRDSNRKISCLQHPGPDNEVRIQILPRFENAYKKIDMTFYIDDMKLDGNMIKLNCIYKVIDLYNSRIKCFGEMGTYKFFETIAQELKLGFASNTEESEEDKRYIYCANDSYQSTMRRVIETSGDSGNNIDSRMLYDYWIDYWNNINLADVYERFNAVDSDEDMMVWVAPGTPDVAAESNTEQSYIQVPACVTNYPTKLGTELYIRDYKLVNSSNQSRKGSDRVVSVYNIKTGESLDWLLGDGDQQKDVFVKYDYVGENYRDFNYLLAQQCHSRMDQKMKEQIVEVTLDSPALFLTRGGKLNLEWYDVDSTIRDVKERLGIDDSALVTNKEFQSTDYDENTTAQYILNKQVSGQYYILNSVIRFKNGLWSTTLQLSRPRESRQTYLDLSEITKSIK